MIKFIDYSEEKKLEFTMNNTGLYVIKFSD